MITYAHRCKTLRDRVTVGRVAVPHQVVWCFIPREGIGDLASDPFRSWIGRYAEGYQPPPFVLENDQNEKQPEADCRHDQEVHGPDARRMVVEKSLPSLRPPSPALRHILGDRRLSDFDPEP